MRVSIAFLAFMLFVACAAPAPTANPADDTDSQNDNDKDKDNGDTSGDGGASSTTYTLTVTIAGTGSGTIISTPGGLSCQDKTCTGSFPAGTTVGLTPAPASGSAFTGWGGACTGTGTCTPVVSSNTSVTATFDAGGNVAGTWNGTYTHSETEPTSGCLFNNQGNLSVTFTGSGTAVTSSANITGLELRTPVNPPNCPLVTNAATGMSTNETVTVSGATASGTWTFAVSGASGNLPLPYTATLSGNTLTGSWTCTGCTGSFTLTRQ